MKILADTGRKQQEWKSEHLKVERCKPQRGFIFTYTERPLRNILSVVEKESRKAFLALHAPRKIK